MVDEDQIKRDCRQTARQLLREQPDLTFRELVGRSEFKFACQYLEFPEAKLIDWITPDLTATEEAPFYENASVWTLEEAVAIWLDRNPLIVLLGSRNPEFWNTAYHPKLRERVSLGIESASRDIIAGKLASIQKNGRDYVSPLDFREWAVEQLGEPKGEAPQRLFQVLLSKESNKSETISSIAPEDRTKSTKSKTPADQQNKKPWLVPDENDPPPEHDWYIPARYFARELIVADSKLLLKRDLLAKKVSDSMFKVDIKKRGIAKRYNPATIKKAFSNVKFG